MHEILKTSIVAYALCFTLSAFATSSKVPDISCRQGKLQLSNPKSSQDRKLVTKYVKDYLQELDRNIFLDHEPAWLQDDFSIKNITLANYDQTIIPQKVSDQVETKLIFEKDATDDACFLMQQKTFDHSISKIKKKQPVKKSNEVSVYRACLTTLTKGQTIFNKHSRFSDQKTQQTTYPYTICTINNDDY